MGGEGEGEVEGGSKEKEGREGGRQERCKKWKGGCWNVTICRQYVLQIQQTLQIINSYQTLVMEGCWIHKKQTNRSCFCTSATNRKQQYQDFWYECGNTGKQLSFSLEYYTKAKWWYDLENEKMHKRKRHKRSYVRRNEGEAIQGQVSSEKRPAVADFRKWQQKHTSSMINGSLEVIHLHLLHSSRISEI